MAAPLALFDFDGTISRADSFIAFMQHTHGKAVFRKLMLQGAPIYAGWKFGLVSSQTAKARAVRDFYTGWPVAHMNQAREVFTKTVLWPMIFPKALEKIAWHKAQKHEVAVVTASSVAWLGDWANQMQVNLISTELEIENGLYTGRLSTPNCIGPEKVKRVLAAYPDAPNRQTYAYGNDHGDRPLLKFATHPHFRALEG